MRRLAPLAIVYALVAVLVAPTTLLADEPASAPTGTQPAPTAAPPPTPSQPAAPAAQPTQTQTQPAAPAQPPAPPAPPAPAPAAADPAPQAQSGRQQRGGGDPVAIAAASGAVTIKDFSFGPSTLTVNAGDTVTWHNNGPTGHSATAKDGSFDTGILPKGQSGSHTFTKPGTYAYTCTPHPFMHGTITVVAASSGSSGSSAATGGSSGSSGTSSGSSTGSTTSSGSSTTGGSTLPKTGSDAWLLAALGLAFLAVGAAMQRRARASD